PAPAIRSAPAGWGCRRRTSASTERPTRRRSATPPRTAASACAPQTPSGSYSTSTSAPPASSSPSSAMASRARLVAQGVANRLVALLFILLAWSLLHDEGGDLMKRANEGRRPDAPDFTLERLDRRGALELSSLRGKAVVLNVWASWCGPCKEEAPYLEEVWQRNRHRDLGGVGLDAEDLRADARR